MGLNFKNNVVLEYCVLPQDCFFVSVVIRNKPALLDKPVAVCHSNNSKGTSEISSANYPARSYGWIYTNLYITQSAILFAQFFGFKLCSMVEDPELLASSIRKEIYETNRCTASAGIGGICLWLVLLLGLQNQMINVTQLQREYVLEYYVIHNLISFFLKLYQPGKMMMSLV
nr:DNA repair protein REV1 isoform X2 [Arachis hypogaea]